MSSATFPAKSISAELIKAARALANITAQELADSAKLGIATVKRAEAATARDASPLTASNADRIIEAFRTRGVIFIPNGSDGMGHGVRLVEVKPPEVSLSPAPSSSE